MLNLVPCLWRLVTFNYASRCAWMDEYTGVRPHTHSHIVNTQIREHRRTHTIPHNFSSLFRVCTAAPPGCVKEPRVATWTLGSDATKTAAPLFYQNVADVCESLRVHVFAAGCVFAFVYVFAHMCDVSVCWSVRIHAVWIRVPLLLAEPTGIVVTCFFVTRGTVDTELIWFPSQLH